MQPSAISDATHSHKQPAQAMAACSGDKRGEASALLDAAYAGDWATVLSTLGARPELVGSARRSGYTVLHQMAWHGASAELVGEVLRLCGNRAEALLGAASRDGVPAEIATARGFPATAMALRTAAAAATTAPRGPTEHGALPTGGGGAAPAAAAAASAPAGGGDKASGETVALTRSEAERVFRVAMHAAAVGDAVGYRGGEWEFCTSGVAVDEQMLALGGAAALLPRKEDGWPVSDDTVMHIATMEAFASSPMRLPRSAGDSAELDALMTLMAERHVACWADMPGRAPGNTCNRGVTALRRSGAAAWATATPFSPQKDTGCGAAMRAMAIGVMYHERRFWPILVATAAESAVLSHHSFAGCASAVVAAAGCALALERVPVADWPSAIVSDFVPELRRYLAARPGERAVPMAVSGELSTLFCKRWQTYSDDPASRMTRETASDPAARDAAFLALKHGWSATSSVLISFQAMHAAGSDWATLLRFSAAHGGDSDSTATICGAWFGAMTAMRQPEDAALAAQSAVVEYSDRIAELCSALAARYLELRE